VPYVLDAVPQSLQLKVWNADKDATRTKYENEINRRWEEARSGADGTRNRDGWNTYMPWLILDNNYDRR